MSNFTLQDVAGSAVAVVVFALALYVLGYAANLFGFRKMSFCERSLWAIAYSFAVTPIAGYLVGRYAGFNAACGLLLGIALVWLVPLWRDRHQFAWSRSETTIACAAVDDVTGWCILAYIVVLVRVFVVAVMLPGFTVGRKLFNGRVHVALLRQNDE